MAWRDLQEGRRRLTRTGWSEKDHINPQAGGRHGNPFVDFDWLTGAGACAERGK